MAIQQFRDFSYIDDDYKYVTVWPKDKSVSTVVQDLTCVHSDQCRPCLAAVLMNLAEPYWVRILCNTSLPKPLLLCKMENEISNKQISIETKPNNFYCVTGFLLINKTCYIFEWLLFDSSTKVECHTNVIDFQHIFSAIDLSQVPPIYSNGQFKQIVKYFNLFSEHNENFQSVSQKGFCIREQQTNKVSAGGNLFRCHGDAYVSVQFLCDGLYDCPDKKLLLDSMCGPANTKHLSQIMKKSVIGFQGCGPMLYTAHDGSCQVFVLAEKSTILKGKMVFNFTNSYSCATSGKQISISLVNDMVVDCFPHGDDEPILKSVTNNKTYYLCEKEHQIACREGHSQCFNISAICTFSLDGDGFLAPCRTGEHLQECKPHQCNVMFKCVNSYCIPWKYVCDGKWDCHFGTDESAGHQCGPKRNCSELFKCRGHQMCIHLNKICDTRYDCPVGDDESHCSLHKSSCPNQCECLSYSIICSQVSFVFKDIKTFSLYNMILFVHSDVPNIKVFQLELVFSFSMIFSNVTDLCGSDVFDKGVKLVDFRFNKIATLARDCFHKSKTVVVLHLAHNMLVDIFQDTFLDLLELKILNLSSNPLTTLSDKAFVNLKNLKMLSLLNMSNFKSNDDIFTNVNFSMLQAGSYQMCCLVHHVAQCSLTKLWYVSCTDLLLYKTITISFMCISVAILLTNIISFSLTTASYVNDSSKTKNAAYEVQVISLNISDVVCAVPLYILWIADLIYTGSFIMNKSWWKSSSFCFITYGLFMNFSLLSPILLGVLSISRYSVVEYPLDSKFKRLSFSLRVITGVYLLCFVVSALLTFLTWLVDIYILQHSILVALCSPFIDPTNQLILVNVSTWLVIILDLTAIMMIIVVYYNLFQSLKKSQERLKGSVSKQQSNTPLLVQVVVISSSNILCWIPSSVVYLSAMFMKEYPVQMVVWTTVAINPLNSLINPIVFCIMSVRKMRK